MRHIFGTRVKSMEILGVLHDLKPAARQMFYDEEMPAVRSFCDQHDMHMVISPFKIDLADAHNPYSNKGVLSEDGMRFVYISKDELVANQCLLFEIRGMHEELGKLLGYPACCTAFFAEHEPERAEIDSNYEEPLLKKSKEDKYPFYNNIFMRHEDICLLSHFPCHLGCEKSMDIAKQNMALIRQDTENLQGAFHVHGRKISFY